MADPWQRKEIIGDCTLYLGDCLEVMPTLDPVDAVVTDPPYGLEDWNTRGTNAGKGQGRAWKGLGRNGTAAHDGEQCAAWDKPLTGGHIAALMQAAPHKIIWGANYLLDHLPRTKQMFVWNKNIRGMHYNDCEIAWTSQWREASRVFDLHPSAAGEKLHPTGKPLALMKWCLDRLPGGTQTILDPFMGSGTTGVACVKLGRKFIGIELEPKYFDIACKRIEKAYAQPDMFIEQERAAKPEQQDLLGASDG